MARERWTGAGEPQDRIRSIYAARSGASGASSAVDFTRMKLADPAQSLRMAYLSHLTPAKAETPREAADLSDNVLRRAFLAHTVGGTGSR